MARIMLLGGSNCQLSAARAVRAMGHSLVLADYLADPPAKALCDFHARVSTFDAAACIAAAKACRVNAVFTAGTDQPVLTAARVAEALGLPSPLTVPTALRATHKHAMKDAFRTAGIPHADYAYLSPGQGPEVLSALTPPLVIKPLDSQGQRGVFKVASASDAVKRLPEVLCHSREQYALVETFYPSDEVTFSGYLSGGRLYPLLLTDRQLLDDPVHIGVCAAHRFPSIHADQHAEITAMCDRVAQAIGVREGPLYVQLLLGKRGILVNEAACRIGGAFEDAMVPYATGFDLLSAVIHTALGEPWDDAPLRHPQLPYPGVQMSVQMFFCKPGTVATLTPLDQLQAFPGVLTAGYNYGVGSPLPAMENATMRFGHCLLATRDGDMAERVEALYRFVRVLDLRGESLLISRTFDGKG